MLPGALPPRSNTSQEPTSGRNLSRPRPATSGDCHFQARTKDWAPGPVIVWSAADSASRHPAVTPPPPERAGVIRGVSHNKVVGDVISEALARSDNYASSCAIHANVSARCVSRLCPPAGADSWAKSRAKWVDQIKATLSQKTNTSTHLTPPIPALADATWGRVRREARGTESLLTVEWEGIQTGDHPDSDVKGFLVEYRSEKEKHWMVHSGIIPYKGPNHQYRVQVSPHAGPSPPISLYRSPACPRASLTLSGLKSWARTTTSWSRHPRSAHEMKSSA